MVEAEDAVQERPVPHQVVERAEENGGGGRAVELRVGRDNDGRAAVCDLDPPHESVSFERVDVRAYRFHPTVEAAMLGDPGFRQRAAALDGAECEAAAELVLRRN